MYDYHVHSNYSDGAFLERMVSAAEAAGLDGIGVTDHCNVFPTPDGQAYKRALGFNLDITYERRREAIATIRTETEIELFDAVEMDYHPAYEASVASFLEAAGFDYAVGSVHELGGSNVHQRSHFADKPETERRELVERYFEKLVALIDSELFEIAAHLDLVERNPHLRGFATREQYERVADALERSRTVPEINAGRRLDGYGEFHPSPPFLDVLVDRDVAFTVGTDSHQPDVIAPRLAELTGEFESRGIDPVEIADGRTPHP